MADRVKQKRRFSDLKKALGRDSRRSLERSLRVEGLEQRQLLSVNPVASDLSYAVVDTGQTTYYNDVVEIAAPAKGAAFYGQDAQYDGNQPSYTLSGDGLTVDDNVTGLTWTQSPDLDRDGDIDAADKLTFSEFQSYADTLNAENFGGHSDWRAPTIKELYSLIDFNGTDPNPQATSEGGLTPFIDTDYFAFAYGDLTAGERVIDAQFWSSTFYESTVFVNQTATFGVNFADGRIKGYPSGEDGPRVKTEFAYFVRGNTDYGINNFTDNSDGTITDSATSLMWSQDDSGVGMDWADALAWVEQMNDQNYLGHDDWRLPNAKELQSIVDYTRSPDTTNSAAIDPLFNATSITNEAGQSDYANYWTGTSHLRFNGSATDAVYVAFGRGLGSMDGVNVIDVHGAGCQRSDPKTGDPNDYPTWGNGPQGDVRRVFNFVRLVRDAGPIEAENTAPTAEAGGPYSAEPGQTITLDGSASTDPDGSITTYAWDLDNDGQYDDASGATAEFSAAAAGTYTVGLQVTDNEGATATDTATLTFGEVATPFEGYTLFSAIGSQDTYLIDNDGAVVHSWKSDYGPGLSAYLLEDGSLMRTASLQGADQWFVAGGASGRVEQWSWDGELEWEFEYSDGYHRLHHDIEVLPNGNVLMIAWEFVDQSEALAAGRDPNLLTSGEIWPDHIIEVEPTGDSGGNIVWEWHTWDHLVQDYDSTQDNYGVVAEHPELIDVNFDSGRVDADWTHINSIDYNADLDQILLSVHGFNEVWVIDHSTTTAEAAGHSGGDSGMGGDLLYRWGNPQAYDAGTSTDQVLFGQHDAEWIEDGLPGEDDILVFNNGNQRDGRAYSSVDEFDPPVTADGSYTVAPGQAYGPADLVWSYTSDPLTSFFADHISGAQRLGNGNTLITDGTSGELFEVSANGEVVWEYAVGGEVFRADRYGLDYAGFDGTDLDDEPVVDENAAPTAEAGGPYEGLIGNAVQLSGSASSDSDGSIVLYEWDLDNDGQYDDAAGATASFVSGTAGSFTVGLRATDDDGATDTDTATIVIESPNTAPTAEAGGPYEGLIGNAVQLSGSASSDSDGSIVAYEWDLDNDGQYDDATGVTASFVSGTTGSFTVGLQVTDDDGATSTDTAAVEVQGFEPVHLGVVDDMMVAGLNVNGRLEYLLEPARNGFLTVQIEAPGLQWQVFDPGTMVEISPVAAIASGRADYDVAGNGSYLLRLSGQATGADLRLVNLVELSGSTVYVHGTEGDDAFSLDSDGSCHVTINGVDYLFDHANVNTVEFDGAAGNDQASLIGTPEAEQIDLFPGLGSLSRRGFTVSVGNTWNIRVDGGGGADVASLVDSDGDDSLVADSQTATMTGMTLGEDAFTNTVVNVPSVHAYALNGGFDRAELSGTAGRNDVFKGYFNPENWNQQYGKLRTDGTVRRAKFFEEIVAQGNEGDGDRAVFFSTTGADTLEAGAGSSTLRNSDVTYATIDFGVVRAYAANGGDDTLILTDSAGDDRFRLLLHKAEATGSTYSIAARAFDHVIADATRFADDMDEVRLYDSPQDEMLTATAGETRLTGGVDFLAKGFQKTKVYSLYSRDHDTAVLEGGAGDDTLEAFSDGNGQLTVRDRVDLLTSTPEGIALLRAAAFDEITVKSGEGDNKADVPDDLSVLDYVLRMEGEWK